MAFWTIDGGGRLPQLCVEIDVTNAPTNPSRVWTDVTTDIRALTYTRGGRNDELQRNQPGTLSATFSSKNAKYDVTNPSGLGVRRSQWIRVRAQWAGVTYARWQGLIQTIDLGWPEAGSDAIATVTAGDAMLVLNWYDLAGQTFTAQTGDQRLSAICALAGLTATIADTGASTLDAVAAPLPPQSFAAAHLQNVEQTENGLIFAGPDGAITFQSRHYRTLFSQTPRGTIGDGGGAIPYRDDAAVQSDDAYLANSVTVTDSGGGTQTVADAASIAQHFQRSNSTIDRSILVSSSGEALACAQWLLARYKEPSPRIPQVSLLGVAATAQWPTILAANNSDRFTFKRSASNVIAQDCFVEKIIDTVIPGTAWNVQLQLSPADVSLFWLAQTVGFGEAAVHTYGSY